MFLRVEYGGLRWGDSFWQAANVTWPLATLRMNTAALEVRLGLWPVFLRRFTFTRSDVTALRPCSGIISSGVQIEHTKANYPPFILFWSFAPARLLADASAAGYPVSN
jgi:hypothetical protein